MLLLKLGSIAIVPVIYSVVLGELSKMLFLTFYVTVLFFHIL